MIEINFYVLRYLGRCEVTPLHILSTIAIEWIGVKFTLARMSLVPEAYYWYKFSIFCSLHATCLN